MNMLIKLFLEFFKIGLVGFGGGMAILPMIYQSVLKFSNITPENFADLFAISQATPGPMAINAATFVGFQIGGVAGAMVATLGVVCPSFILVAASVKLLKKHGESTLVKGGFAGIRPAAVGMIGAAVVLIGQATLFDMGSGAIESFSQALNMVEVIPLIMAAVTIVLAAKFKVGAIKIIIIMGVLGMVLCR